MGDLWVECSTPGGELWVDGQRVASLPLGRALRVVAGTAAVEVRAPGFVAITRVVTVPPGGVAREPVALVALAPSPRAPTVVVPDPVALAPGRNDQRLAAAGDARRTAAWVTMASGGALLVSAGVLYGVGLSVIADYNVDPACPGADAAAQPDACGRRLDTAYTLRALAIAGLVGGGAATVVATALLATAPRTRPARVACGQGPGAFGVACALRF